MMNKNTDKRLRMGGEIPIKLESLDIPSLSTVTTLSFNRSHEIWVDTGRSALRLALDTIVSQHTTRTAWLPSYLCRAITDVFKTLNFSVHFYSVEKDLTMQDVPATIKNGDVFFFIHYFGVRNTSALQWLDQTGKDFWVIEDAVQAPLTPGIGGRSDFIFTSMRKILPQPDGALLSSNHEIKGTTTYSSETFISKKFMGKLLRDISYNDSLFLELLETSEEELESANPRTMSFLSKYMMERTDLQEVAILRQNNFFYLRELLSEIHDVLPLFADFPEETIPLGFPILVPENKRDYLRQYLMARNIFCPIHWLLDSPVTEITSAAHSLSRSILTLPIEQSYNKALLEYLYAQIKEFFKTVAGTKSSIK